MWKAFYQLRHLGGDFWCQISDSMIFDMLVSKTRIVWPNGAQIKECAEILAEVSSDQTSHNTTTPGKVLWFQ
jgi:hypothetical protein